MNQRMMWLFALLFLLAAVSAQESVSSAPPNLRGLNEATRQWVQTILEQDEEQETKERPNMTMIKRRLDDSDPEINSGTAGKCRTVDLVGSLLC